VREQETPLFSIITPVCDPPPEVLLEAIESVRSQRYISWELCLADDASTDSRVRDTLREAAEGDQRIRLTTLPERSGIVGASRRAIESGSGEWLAFLDHDDLLHPEALAMVAEAIGTHPDADYVYTDEDKVDEKGHHFETFLKPQWSPERLRSQMYTAHFSVLRRELYDRVGGLREGFDGAQDWDLVLRATEQARRVLHIPEVLYHWRSVATSAAASTEAKPWAFIAAQRAIEEQVERLQMRARVEPNKLLPSSAFSLAPAPDHQPHVTVVVPTRGTRREVRGRDTLLIEHALRGLAEQTDYEAWDVVCVADSPYVDQASVDLAFLGDRLSVVEYSAPFNFSEKINRGVDEARGELLLFLNDDIEVGERDWLGRLVAHASAPGVGAVGPKLLFEDTRIQHAGVIISKGEPIHVYYEFPRDTVGYFNQVVIASNLSAVTGACLLTTREAFDAVGGMSEDFPINYNDVDYCLKLRERGYRVVYAGDIELTHLEHGTREGVVADTELERFWRRWPEYLSSDPFVNPRLRRRDSDLLVPLVSRKDGSILGRPDPMNVMYHGGLRGLRTHAREMLPPRVGDALAALRQRLRL
jgi:GT2 family glycosyltransferase